MKVFGKVGTLTGDLVMLRNYCCFCRYDDSSIILFLLFFWGGEPLFFRDTLVKYVKCFIVWYFLKIIKGGTKVAIYLYQMKPGDGGSGELILLSLFVCV